MRGGRGGAQDFLIQSSITADFSSYQVGVLELI
jgi:hypothetical protein